MAYLLSITQIYILSARNLNIGSLIPVNCVLHQIFQRHAVNILLNNTVKSLPEWKRGTIIAARAFIGRILQAGDHRKISLHSAQNVPNSIILWASRKSVPASVSSRAFKVARLAQHAYDLLHIFNGNILSFRNVPEWDKIPCMVLCQIQHNSQRIAAFCRYFHGITSMNLLYHWFTMISRDK